MVFLDIQPAMMRSYRPLGSSPIGMSGENVSPVLFGLREQPDQLDDIVGWLGELCAPNIKAIDFDKTEFGEVMMFVVEQAGRLASGSGPADGRKISARSLSDGTLRFLGLLVALLTCPPGTLMVLEEPDVGLHPSRIRLLAELFEQLAKKRGIQILATTHSPTLLAHLSDQALGDVVAFGRDPDSGCTIGSRLSDLPDFEVLRTSRDVAHLVSTGWLERAL
jgi:predicted ATPase